MEQVETDLIPLGEVGVAFDQVAQVHQGVVEGVDLEVVQVVVGFQAFLVETFQLVESQVVASFLVEAYLQ